MTIRGFVLVLMLLTGIVGCTTSTGPEENIAMIYIHNRTSSAVEHVQIADCATNSIATHRFGSNDVFQPNTIRAFAVTPGCWNLRVEAGEGRFAERSAIQLDRSGTFEWTLTDFGR